MTHERVIPETSTGRFKEVRKEIETQGRPKLVELIKNASFTPEQEEFLWAHARATLSEEKNGRKEFPVERPETVEDHLSNLNFTLEQARVFWATVDDRYTYIGGPSRKGERWDGLDAPVCYAGGEGNFKESFPI